MDALHPIVRRYWAEDLVRLRRADEQRRYLASQRSGRVDPNPHQIDAVIFALQRIPLGGCILADEVGLGKTIEAGLTMAQLLAEGASRILLITPKPLLGQWKEELYTLFGMHAKEGATDPGGFEGAGVFVVGREYAGSDKGAEAIESSGRFDLCVIDEAHEIFAGIYRRYDRHGKLRDGSRYARLAARVKRALGDSPVLLLTATPIQNTLTELWGLVQYIEPTSALLGDLATFRTVFCDGDDRRIRPGQGEELKRRIAEVCQRTLRRQAQEFMERPFRRRSARLFEYSMSADESALYDDVTAYLLDPKTLAFSGSHRRLLLISFHRRMGSSVAALAASLQAVADRLRRRLGGPDGATLGLFVADLEDEVTQPESVQPSVAAEERRIPDEPLVVELRRVEALVDQARALSADSKATELVTAVRYLHERAREGEGSGKVVIFTEALTTQEYLRDRLVASGLVSIADVTLFRGQNDGPRAREAFARWDAEVSSLQPESRRASRSVGVRLALVHEFATRTSVLISTEAGAKGLNLQFCENVINYDLPWNPQRIEQRIGRCHRYGQTRDVTVVNFLCRGNEAQRLTFEILSRKLDLFGTVLDASDAVLHESSGQGPGALITVIASDFEERVADVYAKARNVDELNAGLGALEAEISEERATFDQTHARTAGLIETRFDLTVRAAFRALADETPAGLADLDADLLGVLCRYFEAEGIDYTCTREPTRTLVAVEPHPALPDQYAIEGARLRIGRPGDDEESYEPGHVGHRLVRAALEEARRATRDVQRVRISPADSDDPVAGLPAACRGRLALLKIQYPGYEPTVDLLLVAAANGDAAPVFGADALALLEGRMEDQGSASANEVAVAEDFEDAIEEALFVSSAAVADREHRIFEDTVGRIERAMEDRIVVCVRARLDVDGRLAEAVARRDNAVGSHARTRAELECRELESEREDLLAEIERLRRRDDPDYHAWRLRALSKRYAQPSCERMLEVEFELA